MSKQVEKTNESTQEIVLKRLIKGRTILNRSYPQLNGRNIVGAIDDWTKRFNGYIPAASPLLDSDQSRMFLNFTRNEVTHYLSNTALNRPKTKVKAVNKRTGSTDPKFSEVCNDLLDFSANEENGDARFLEDSLQVTTEGTIIDYEGYARDVQKMKTPQFFDAETGKIKIKEENRVVYDNCFQRIVPVEDFLIANPYQPDVQKQPWVIWREVTTYDEAACEFKDYKDWEK